MVIRSTCINPSTPQKSPGFAPSALLLRAWGGPIRPVAFPGYAMAAGHVKESAPELLLGLCLGLGSGRSSAKAEIRHTGQRGRNHGNLS